MNSGGNKYLLILSYEDYSSTLLVDFETMKFKTDKNSNFHKLEPGSTLQTILASWDEKDYTYQIYPLQSLDKPHLEYPELFL